VRYLTKGGDFLWWSERSGWGHYYLYDFSGKLKNQVTSGAWRAEAIVELDSIRGIVWVRGVGREANEAPYYSHLYRVNLDGSGIALLDAGDATHQSRLTPSRHWVIDTYSRTDLVPKSVLRDAATGAQVMELETMDISRLEELGWKAPERFSVKAADGVSERADQGQQALRLHDHARQTARLRGHAAVLQPDDDGVLLRAPDGRLLQA
jgi:dipeptidyl-peptidase-4